MAITRSFDRSAHDLRPVRIEPGPMKFADGSALIEVGDTRVLAGATLERRVPPFLVDQNRGWATAEYAMLPRSTPTRSTREATRGRPSGRTFEIQRLIGRSLRSVLALEEMPGFTLILDCDVLQADGGTRTASITGAYVAAAQALAGALLAGDLKRWPLRDHLAAVSVGIVDDKLLLDLDASEDQRAAVDMNVVATGSDNLVEIQITGEQRSFSRGEFDGLMDLALAGIDTLFVEQQRALESILGEVRAVEAKGRRTPAAPRDEKELWGKP